MAPSATATPSVDIAVHPGKPAAAIEKLWVKSTGALDHFEHFDVTPTIGREYPHIDIVALLKAPNSEELLKELALTSAFPLFQIHLVSPSTSKLISPSLPTRRCLLPVPKQPHSRPTKRTHPKNWPRRRQALYLRSPHPPNPQLRA